MCGDLKRATTVISIQNQACVIVYFYWLKVATDKQQANINFTRSSQCFRPQFSERLITLSMPFDWAG